MYLEYVLFCKKKKGQITVSVRPINLQLKLQMYDQYGMMCDFAVLF